MFNGNGRGFNPAMTAGMNKVYLEIDFSTGTGFVQVNHSCTDSTLTNCTQANSLMGQFNSDGNVHVDFAVGQSVFTQPGLNIPKISASIDIVPTGGGGVCIFGSATRFPAIEAYYDLGGSTSTIFQMTELPVWEIGLLAPRRSFPACQTTEVPPFNVLPPPA